LQFSLRCINTAWLTGQSMLFRLWIVDLPADPTLPHQQTASQTTATQNAEQMSKRQLCRTLQNLMHKSSAEAKQYAAI